MSICDDCHDAELIRDCLVCGAPVCCPKCCAENTLEICDQQAVEQGVQWTPLCAGGISLNFASLLSHGQYSIEWPRRH